MADDKTLFRQALLSVADISALTGGRIYYGEVPKNSALPSISYFRVSGVGSMTHNGDFGFRRSRFQVDCFALTQRAVTDLKEKTILGLAGFRGSFGSPPSHIDGIFLLNEEDMSQLWREAALRMGLTDDSDLSLRSVQWETADFQMWYRL